MVAHLLLLTGVSLATSSLGQDAPPTQTDQPPSHTPPVTAKISALAHRVLNAGLKANALDGDDLQPWHLKADFQVVLAGTPKPAAGTLEVWSTGRYQWKRAYIGALPQFNGIEWSVSQTERYRTKPGQSGFQTAWLNLRVTRPVIAPLYQAANIKRDFDMNIQRVNTGGLVLNCVSVADPSRYADQTDPDWLFPTMGFDGDMHLRLVSASDTTVQFDDIQIFQNRAVARDVKVIVKGNLIAEMKVSLLEPLAATDAAGVKPDKGAAVEPYTIEPGSPRPESVYEVGASLPIRPDGLPYSGVFPFPVLIHKDGSVKANPEGVSFALRALSDALELAISKWKYKPYMVDGQPVEVAIIIPYILNGKPFVPSYDRPKPTPVTTSPEDFSSAYDPKRDPKKDLAMAEAQARPGKKRILLDVGGDWCIWCKYLDNFFADHADIRELRDENYVLMKVNMSAMNENYAFLSQYPNIPGYPWLFVLDSDGKLLKSENTDELENGANGYSAQRIKQFLSAWESQ
jgi:hypothetical protein